MQLTQEPDTRSEKQFPIPYIKAAQPATPIVPTRALVVTLPEPITVEGEVTVLDAPRKRRPYVLIVAFICFLCLIAVCAAILYPFLFPTATVTIIPKTEKITTTQSVQLPARVLAPLTLSQSKTIPTTGKGHQPALHARGYITFYNGLFTSQTIAAGTILTGSDGTQVITDQLASIPAANPPGLGKVTVSAQAIATGAQGNISVYAINQLCCSTAVKAVNTTAFHGGQNEWYFSTVSTQDINKLSTQLKETLSHSMQGAFTAQLTPAEALIPPLCSEKIMPDHQPGAEAITVTVTVSETCSAVAYDKASLQEKASQLLTTTATHQLGAGYSLLGDIQYQLVQATIQKGIAILQITCSGVWVYQFSQAQQQHLMNLIAGNTKEKAKVLLLSTTGIEGIVIDGKGERLPDDPTRITFVVAYRA